MKPEKLVEQEVMSNAWQHGFDLTVIESKAVYSKSIGRYIRGQTSESVTDLVGNRGIISCYIELKAKGKRSQFNTPKNYRQRAFVERKINSGAFVCVVDSWDLLWKIFNLWIREESPILRRKILFDNLP